MKYRKKSSKVLLSLLSVHCLPRSAVGAEHLGVHRDWGGETSKVAGLGPQGEPGLPPPHRPQQLRQLLHLPGEVPPPRAGQHGETDQTRGHVTLYMYM